MAIEQLDALVVGAGFAGLYQLHKLNQLGLKSAVVEAGSDVGGTWYWNRYPGAMSDTEAYVYRFSWDREDLLTYPWKETYVKQPEVQAYLSHVAKRHDLYKDIRFNTEMTNAAWDDGQQRWEITLNGNTKVAVRYLITALGLLSKQNFPDIPGIESFKGEKVHTGKWPKDCTVEGKRVAVIGCGSTGVQVITEIGQKVKQLTCFQRHPQYSVPSGDVPMTKEYRDWINDNWDDIFKTVRNSITAFGFKEATRSYHEFTPEEREAIFEENWQKGNGFRFMFGTFNDIAVDREANEGACEFIRNKIDTIVKDPEKARKLKPHDLYARRPLCDGNASNGQRYFEQFNRPNVDIVDLKETPIERMEPEGIRTSDGKLYELDMIVFATGFDAVEGNYMRIAIQGRDGLTLKQAWDEKEPTTYLGVCMPEFPNFFMICGPKGPFTNLIPAIEAEIEFASRAIEASEKCATKVVEATHEAEQSWTDLCETLAEKSLFWKATDNWIFGANVPGKKRSLRFFFGGMQMYLQKVADEAAQGYPGFKPFA